MQRGVLGARSSTPISRTPSIRTWRENQALWLGLRSGDKVMQTENDYDREIFNDDLRRVKRIDQTDGVLIAGFDGREVKYPFGELDALVPAYAMTIHKSRGRNIPPW